ncbi:RipA family octameric membrane protein [Marinobacter salarius]|jgi:hypothetical protein|uniref:RipA family octameric membrane protein n=1 Tax=Marinobacter salarius TaxID=1420917 RepID=UPI00241F1CDF|nr:hypothetical protein [Marinobacter salarius]
MYLADIAATIRSHIPEGRMPGEDSEGLLLLYATLLRVKGTSITNSDIHDAWAAWMAERDVTHISLIPYNELSEEVQEEDRVFATAVRKAAEELERTKASRPEFGEILFPSGPPKTESETREALDLYKIMVQSSEGLVSRRQNVNTFFLTMNGALLTAFGLILQGSGGDKFGALGVAVLALAGVILCGAWRSLITSFGQLNRGKFQVINTIERYLKAAIYAAEWEALGRGEDPGKYRSFTSREIWVPNALIVIHGIIVVVALLVFSGCIDLGNSAVA